MRLMEGEHVGPFNLGNPGEFTMLELAEVIYATDLAFTATKYFSNR
jgi:UDP-glucuronate decarboxylase